ncbi:hypothetical protein RS130_11275 [Paraglaciecola aquimarina]|uniref:Transposase n=1 Tax=Paraglaciecola aquimarina TaxID=1235557 RepID=A0ABU3SWT1_9ALTE|nr:hypothetical protein [Paraglaciecola aquimarina]MDU0354437.1 hypothetical protein [Paraglaciecola aquimarina]
MCEAPMLLYHFLILPSGVGQHRQNNVSERWLFSERSASGLSKATAYRD